MLRMQTRLRRGSRRRHYLRQPLSQARFRRLHRKSPREKAALPVAQALHDWIEIEKQRPERDRSEDLPAALALYTALEGRK